MKTLLIAEKFLPLKGGSVTIYNNVYSRYKKDEIIVLTEMTRGWKEYDRKTIFSIYRVPYIIIKFLKPESLLIYIFFLINALILVVSKNIKVIHCDAVLRSGFVGYMVNKILKVPYIVYVHGEEVLLRMAKNRSIMVKIYNSSSFMIANSNTTKSLITNLGVSREKIVVIHPGVDYLRFNPNHDPSSVRKCYGLEGRPILLTVGRLERRKGYDMVIRTLPIVLKKFPTLVYLMVGKEEEGEREEVNLRLLVKELGVEKNVIFTGEISDTELPFYYCCCDIFIMASRHLEQGHIEGFGIVFLEAAACAKPTIGGKSGGIGEAIIDGITGFLVNPCDINEIAEKIVILLENPHLSKKMGLEGRKMVETKFSWDTYYKEVRLLEQKLKSAFI